MTRKLGIYIHVPFCERKCPYCDFYSRAGDEQEFDRYTETVIRYIGAYKDKKEVDTIYFGGGTPSLLGAKRLLAILEGVKAHFTLTKDCEITLEANPVSSVQNEFLQLVEGGFNRISFGIQSTNPKMLQTLGRLHSREQGFSAIMDAYAAGFRNISADLMVGIPGQSFEEIETSLQELAALPITHLSVYLLKLEEGTAFYKRYGELDEDFSAECYELVVARAEELGFAQYEISNFAKIGYESRHNLRYWRLEDYIGIGPSAHSMVGKKRFYFTASLADFFAGGWEDVKEDGDAGDLEEEILLALRLREGLDLQKLTQEHGAEVTAKICAASEVFLKQGLLFLTKDRLALTTKGFLLSNSIIVRLLESIA